MLMKRSRCLLTAILLILLLVPLCGVVYPLSAMLLSRRNGVYATPQEVIASQAKESFPGYPDLDIQRAGPNAHDGSNPHIWYIIWRACREDPAQAGQRDCQGGGSYVLHATDGWFWMGEGYLPELAGFWMKILGLAAL